jgi:hypothetical protein
MSIHNVEAYNQQVVTPARPVFTVALAEDHRVRQGAFGPPQQRPCARHYHTTDPVEIGRKLTDAGFMVTKTHLNRRGNVALLEARYPATQTGEGPTLLAGYVDFVKFYLDHRGRRPILVQAGALRCACDNQFTTPAVEIPHCSRDAVDFLADPAKWAFNARYLAHQARERIESLRGVPGGTTLIGALEAWPKLHRKALEAFPAYINLDDYRTSAWAALQAMTETKSPRLVEMTCRALAGGYDQVREGRVPDCWAN